MIKSVNNSDVIKYFNEISKIYRSSGEEDEILDYLVNFSNEHNLKYKAYKSKTIIIYKDGTENFRTHETVILSTHMDMAYIRDDSFDENEKVGVDIKNLGNYFSASGSNLGANGGIGLSYVLSILASSDLEHPPLECIITSCKENNMTGAKSVEESDISGKMLINLDSINDKEIVTSSANSSLVTVKIPIEKEKASGILFKINMTGLSSGHSGYDIVKERANAIKLMGRFLYYLHLRIPYKIKDISGGNISSQIPDYAKLEVVISEKDRDQLVFAASTFDQILKDEYKISEPNIKFSCKYEGKIEGAEVLDSKSQKNLRFFLIQAPNGIRKMSRKILGLVRTSLNLGSLRIEGGDIVTKHLVRSSAVTETKSLIDLISVLTEFLGGSLTIGDDIPAWGERSDSYMLKIVEPIYEELFGEKPMISSTHASLENGIYAEKFPKIEQISIGATIINGHSIDEKVYIKSIEKSYLFLVNILKKL